MYDSGLPHSLLSSKPINLRPATGGSLPAIRPGGTWAPPVATPPVATPAPVAGYAGQAMTCDDMRISTLTDVWNRGWVRWVRFCDMFFLFSDVFCGNFSRVIVGYKCWDIRAFRHQVEPPSHRRPWHNSRSGDEGWLNRFHPPGKLLISGIRQQKTALWKAHWGWVFESWNSGIYFHSSKTYGETTGIFDVLSDGQSRKNYNTCIWIQKWPWFPGRRRYNKWALGLLVPMERFDVQWFRQWYHVISMLQWRCSEKISQIQNLFSKTWKNQHEFMIYIY